MIFLPMFNIFKKYFNYNERELQRLMNKVGEINAHEEKAKSLKDADFKKETAAMKDALAKNPDTIDSLLPWAYALVREATVRSLGMRHFDVQMMGGISLHEGKVIEQKTGEGKTLTATLPLYLNALTGKGVHLVTVNDYLARRDAGWMGMVFDFLGLTTAAMIADTSYIFDASYTDSEQSDWRLEHLRQTDRKSAYQADITYGINSEFGFDYLRDNMAETKTELVQRGFYFAIIDEADSVLIDEARTPHIISAPYEQDTKQYARYAQIVRKLEKEKDYVLDEKLKTAHLTDQGIATIEKALGIENIYEKDFETLFHIEASLKAETLFENDRDYIVKEGEVIIVDEFTGRLLPGRRFSEGLHQAIEAKENVMIQRESKTLATVSLQNYFRMYEKLAGMTGTAATEAEEFHKIYKTDVIVIPTQRPMVRKDHTDMIYKTEKAKFKAVVEDIAENYKKGRPVLVGTTSINKNEYLSQLLKQKGVPHEMLNAKNHEHEAQIIARAGERGAITVATNMAGRGVDIILGGEQTNNKKDKAEWQKKHDEVVNLGGLYVIGTERHESRRIDNQLRGRSGRQGDPGESRFYVSLEDDLMRIFGGDQIGKLMNAFNFPEDVPLSHSLVSRAIESAQVKVEGFNFDIRKHLVEFDDVLNKQREIVYSLRRKLLLGHESTGDAFAATITSIFNERIEEMIADYTVLKEGMGDAEVDNIVYDIDTLLPVEKSVVHDLVKRHAFEKLRTYLLDRVKVLLIQKEKVVGKEVWESVMQSIFLQVIDQFWTEHLTSIEDLREGINLRGYAQLDPLVEYKNEAYKMFEKLLSDINYESMRRVFHLQVEVEAPPTKEAIEEGEIISEKSIPALEKKTNAKKKIEYKSAAAIDPFSAQMAPKEQSAPQTAVQTEAGNNELGFKVIPPGIHQVHLGRNDPCPCGSGKKWKKCHYPNIPQ